MTRTDRRTDRRDTAASLLASGEAPSDVAAVVGVSTRHARRIAAETTGRRGTAGRKRSAAVTPTTARGRAALAQLVADAAAAGIEVEAYLRAVAAGLPAPSGAALARELGVDRFTGVRLLRELRAAGLATAARVGPSGRTYSTPRAESAVVRLPESTLARLEALAPGLPVPAQVAAAVSGAQLDRALASPTATLRGAVVAHADHPGEIRTEALDLGRARVVGVDYAADGSPLELHLDVGGTGQAPTWRVVVVFPRAS